MSSIRLFTLMAILFAWSSSSLSQSLPTDDQKSQTIWNNLRLSAVVLIEVECNDKSKHHGTGFIVGHRYVLTVRHVLLSCTLSNDYMIKRYTDTEISQIQDRNKSETKKITIIRAAPFREEIITFSEVELSPEADFALIDILDRGGTRKLPSLCISNRQSFEQGKFVSAFGFGRGESPVYRQGYVDNPATHDRFAQSNITFGEGWSGAPVTNAKGFVVGVVIGGSPGAGLFLPLSRVRSMLIDRDVLPTLNTVEPEIPQFEAYGACSVPGEAILDYLKTETLVDQEYTHPRGGWDPEKACNSIIENLKARYPAGALFKGIPSRPERGEKNLVGEMTYRYWCTVTVQIGPIFKATRNRACPARDVVVDPIECLP